MSYIEVIIARLGRWATQRMFGIDSVFVLPMRSKIVVETKESGSTSVYCDWRSMPKEKKARTREDKLADQLR